MADRRRKLRSTIGACSFSSWRARSHVHPRFPSRPLLGNGSFFLPTCQADLASPIFLPFPDESKSDRLSNDAHLEKEARKKGIRNRVIMYVQGDSEICIDITYLRMWIISFSFFWVHYSKINKVLCISSNKYDLKSKFLRPFLRKIKFIQERCISPSNDTYLWISLYVREANWQVSRCNVEWKRE